MAAIAVASAGVSRIMVTLLGPDPKIHDIVAGSRGAFDETVAALDVLAGIRDIEVRLGTVLTRDNVMHFAGLVEACGTRIPGRLESAAIAEPSSPNPEDYEELAVEPKVLMDALEGASPGARRRMVQLLVRQAPTCVLVAADRDDALEALKGSPSQETTVLEVGQAVGAQWKKRQECPLANRCSLAEHCPGLFQQHLALFGTSGLEPVK